MLCGRWYQSPADRQAGEVSRDSGESSKKGLPRQGHGQADTGQQSAAVQQVPGPDVGLVTSMEKEADTGSM